jgi:UDP-N-acetylmuramate dehydrogenase
VSDDLLWEDEAQLGELNTLRLPCRARHLARAGSAAAVRRVLDRAERTGLPVHVLGEGSNVVLPPRIEGIVLQLTMADLEATEEGAATRVHLGAGLDWYCAVRILAGRGLWGIENLALIPGTVGAAPVQNIGAYGQELAGTCSGVTVLDRRDGEIALWSAADCEFGYRGSRFRREGSRWLVLGVELLLSRDGEARTDYAGVREALGGDSAPTPLRMAETISRIRRQRLPDPRTLPNAGSFFKNPVVDAAKLAQLQERYPALPAHAGPAGTKIPAAWLIEQCGWKGRRRAGVGVARGHALVLVHHGGADGRALMALAGEIRDSVRDRFGIRLEQEPLLLGWEAPTAG